MTTADITAQDPMEHARALFAAKPDGLIEAIAREAKVSTRAVLELLPAAQRQLVAPERFEDVWKELATWGTVLFLMHTPDIVLECEGSLPVGSFGHGYYNIHGDSPIGGHIRKDRCASIAFIDRAFHGRRSCSIWFMNGDGAAMFKIFVRRDAARELDAAQLGKFEALKARYAG